MSPTLVRLAGEGVRAQALVPVFPTKTFPNHYTIVTGRYPARHGIVGNQFTAPELGSKLSMGDRNSVQDSRFWGGEPIWVTAEKQGQPTAPFFWPGSEAMIGGVRPTYPLPFDRDLPDTTLVARVLRLLELPMERRPTFLTMYFSGVDSAGHAFGPDSKQVNRAIARVDGTIGLLIAGLARRGLSDSVNLVIVSDHGMASVDPTRVIRLSRYLDRGAVQADNLSPTLMAWPAPGLEDSVYRGLQRARHLTAYRRADLPPRFHLDESPRVPPIVAVADQGWTIAWGNADEQPWSVYGDHGYDDSLPAMHAIFIARGPAFPSGLRVPPFRNIHLYALFAEILGLTPVPTDGSLDSVRAMLAECDSRHCVQR